MVIIMPFINVKTTCPISRDKECVLSAKLGEAITVVKKSESWLQIGFEDNARLWFGGKEGNCAYIEVSVLGEGGKAYYSDMTKVLCDMISSELAIPPERIYVKYTETDSWGWNGGNF